MHTTKKRYSVLTFIFGGYENVREVREKDPEAEYILVTDDATLKSDTWHIVTDERLAGMSVIDKCYYVRYHPFEYCDTQLCFRIDGSILVKNSLAPIVDAFEQDGADVMVMLNPVHNHLHNDYAQWVRTRDYPQERADKAMKMLLSLGYSETYKGYYQICISLERDNELTHELDDRTYAMLKELGTRGQIESFDQPIWSFMLNKHFEKRIRVMPVTEYLITASRYMQWCWHKSNKAIPFKTDMKPPYLFNHTAECRNFDEICNTPPGKPNSFMLDEISRLRTAIDESGKLHRQRAAEYESALNSIRDMLEEKQNEATALHKTVEKLSTLLDEAHKESCALRNSKNYRLGDAMRHPGKWLKKKLKKIILKGDSKRYP